MLRTLLASALLSGGPVRMSPDTIWAGITRVMRGTFTKTASISEETLH